ncbi:hypothetical protein EHI42_01830 [Rhizobium hidalgonense]|nr:hypothetical protein EHI42_01830 [Rhizobium hidalgonense]
MMTLFPWPDRMTSPGGCKTSVERLARDDLGWRFFDFKTSKQKNSTLHLWLLTHWKGTITWASSIRKIIDGCKIFATFRLLRHGDGACDFHRIWSVSSKVMA